MELSWNYHATIMYLLCNYYESIMQLLGNSRSDSHPQAKAEGRRQKAEWRSMREECRRKGERRQKGLESAAPRLQRQVVGL